MPLQIHAHNTTTVPYARQRLAVDGVKANAIKAQVPDRVIPRHQRHVSATRDGCMDQHHVLPIQAHAQQCTQHALRALQRLIVDGVQQETRATTGAVREPVPCTRLRLTVKAMVEDGRTRDAALVASH